MYVSNIPLRNFEVLAVVGSISIHGEFAATFESTPRANFFLKNHKNYKQDLMLHISTVDSNGLTVLPAAYVLIDSMRLGRTAGPKRSLKNSPETTGLSPTLTRACSQKRRIP
jgi:hypothetical protein